MPKLPEGEIHTPYHGVADTAIIGNGLLDLSSNFNRPPTEWLDITLKFIDEGTFGSPIAVDRTYSEVHICACTDSDDRFAGYSDSEKYNIETCAELLIKLVKRNMLPGVYTGDIAADIRARKLEEDL